MVVTQQTWTVLHYVGPNHLGLWSDCLSHCLLLAVSQEQIWTVLHYVGPNHLGLWSDCLSHCLLPGASQDRLLDAVAGGGAGVGADRGPCRPGGPCISNMHYRAPNMARFTPDSRPPKLRPRNRGLKTEARITSGLNHRV